MFKKNFLSKGKNSSQYNYDKKCTPKKLDDLEKELKMNDIVFNSTNYSIYADTIDILQYHIIECPPKSAQWLKREKYKFSELPKTIKIRRTTKT